MPNFRDNTIRLLRWSEKYTKTDMVYLARGGFFSVLGQATASFSSLILAIVVSRYLPKEIYGDYKYVLSIVALLATISLTGIGEAVFQSAAHGFDGSLREGFWINLRWSALIFLGAIAGGGYYLLLHNYVLGWGILIGGCLSPLLTSWSLASSFIAGKKDFARLTVYFGIFDTIIPIIALIVTIFFTSNPLVLVIVYFLSNTLCALYFYERTKEIYRPDNSKTDPGMLSYGKHLSAMGILSGIAGNIDQILLFHFVGPAELAIYNFATAIPDQTKGPLKMFDSMVQAQFATRESDEIRSGMNNKVSLLFIFTLIVTAFYIVLAPFIFKLLFPNYLGAVFFSQIYAVSMLTYALAPGSSYLSVKKKIKEQYATNIATSIFQIAVMVIGVIWWGLIGLVVARVLTRFFGSATSFFLYQRAVRSSEA